MPFKYWTISKYLTRISDAYIVSIPFISVRWWKTLPHSLQQIMLEEGKKLDNVVYKYALKQDQIFQGIWKKNGGTVIEFPAAEKKKLLDLVRPVGKEVTSRDPGVKAEYDKLVAAAKAARQ